MVDENRNSGTGESENSGSGCIFCAYCPLCFAVATITIIFLLTIIFYEMKIPAGFGPPTISKYLTLFYGGLVAPFISFLASIIVALSPWGIIFFAIVLLLGWGPAWIRETVAASRLEFPGGFKFDGTGYRGAFRKELNDATRLVWRFNKEVKEAYDAAEAFSSQLRDQRNIPTLASETAKNIAALVVVGCPSDFRLTIYIPDLLFSDRLYQMVEYYDGEGTRVSDGKTGRVFSIRYGVIGRVWRSGVSEIEGDLIAAEDRQSLNEGAGAADVERFIARRWGLTLDEAEHVSKYNSYGAIRLEWADRLLGVLYFDSKQKNAFGGREDMDQLLTGVRNLLKGSDLLRRLSDVIREVTPWSGRIEVIKNARI